MKIPNIYQKRCWSMEVKHLELLNERCLLCSDNIDKLNVNVFPFREYFDWDNVSMYFAEVYKWSILPMKVRNIHHLCSHIPLRCNKVINVISEVTVPIYRDWFSVQITSTITHADVQLPLDIYKNQGNYKMLFSINKYL